MTPPPKKTTKALLLGIGAVAAIIAGVGVYYYKKNLYRKKFDDGIYYVLQTNKDTSAASPEMCLIPFGIDGKAVPHEIGVFGCNETPQRDNGQLFWLFKYLKAADNGTDGVYNIVNRWSGAYLAGKTGTLSTAVAVTSNLVETTTQDVLSQWVVNDQNNASLKITNVGNANISVSLVKNT